MRRPVREVCEELAQTRLELAELRERLAAATAPPPAGTEVTAAHLEAILALALVPSEPIAVAPTIAQTSVALRELEGNLRMLRAFEEMARRHHRRGNPRGVLTFARAAADWCWNHHPGLYVSDVLESLLRETGSTLVPAAPPPPPRSGPRRVLHVLTTAAAIGGHTRLAERWIRFDSASEADVVLTDQGAIPVPPGLADAVDGRLTALAAGDPVAQVVDLAARLRRYDAVVLHVHPYDAVTIAACGASGRPPVIFSNHADHVFWLGAGAADLVACIRPSGQALANERRGIDLERSAVLPIPLDLPEPGPSRDAARTAVGLPADALVMTTMASEMKYAPVPGSDFAAAIDPILAAHRSAHLVAIGPTDRHPGFHALAEAHPGRVHLLGNRPDPRAYLKASDLYLDSFPFSSLTSMLEAALHGVPAVSLALPDAGAMSIDEPELALASDTSLEAWSRRVVAYLDDPALREHDGRRLAEQIAERHGPLPWRRTLERIDAAAIPGAARIPHARSPRLDADDEFLLRYLRYAGVGGTATNLLATYGLLPAVLA